MPPDPDARDAFQYAVIRVVPLVEREEFLNVGIVLFCRTRSFLAARVELDEARLRTLAPAAPTEEISAHLAGLVRVAAGDEAAGPIARLPQSERFHWLVAPSSTAIQTSSVHTGLCADPSAALDHLMGRLVLRESTA